MERDGLIEDRAFAFLAPASSHANVKPGDVGQELVDTANQP
jgi:hypothetical protein